jgi:hypothetical protein
MVRKKKICYTESSRSDLLPGYKWIDGEGPLQLGIKAGSLAVWEREQCWHKSIFSTQATWTWKDAATITWNDGRTRRSPAKPFTP